MGLPMRNKRVELGSYSRRLVSLEILNDMLGFMMIGSKLDLMLLLTIRIRKVLI